jgi:predicted nuclease of predicted toxin-antitoxin system
MSGFSVKLDEYLAQVHLHLLLARGYEADTVRGEGLSGSSDERLWTRVVADGRFLVTLDLDFSDIRRFHPGILLIRAKKASAVAVLEVLRRVLDEQPLEDLKRFLAVADERVTRVRRPPE